MEFEDDAPLRAEVQGNEEDLIIQPSQDEPIADAEWVAHYYKERQEQEG